MKDFYDVSTPDLLTGETTMLFQVNYKYVHANGKLRSAAIMEEAKDSTTAVKQAHEKLKAEHDRYQITSTTQWKS